MCLVEMEKAPKPIASCAMPAADGMVIKTNTETVKKVYKEYEEICQRDHLVDFGELLLKSYECLLNSKSVKTFFQTRFKSVLIDEFHETHL